MNGVGEGCAFITGGSRGIGAAIAHELAKDGWNVAIGYQRDHQAANSVVRALPAGVAGKIIQCDVTSQHDVDTAFTGLETEFGHVAVLVNNAGTHKDGLAMALTDADWAEVLDVNLTGAFRAARRAASSMVRARAGRIINVTSILAQAGLPGTANYSSAKAGLAGLTRALAVELAPRGVTVNAVAPGLIRTDLVSDVSHFDESCRRSVPMKRPGTVQEVAACVGFLASSAASYITGQTLTVDGGISASAFGISN